MALPAKNPPVNAGGLRGVGLIRGLGRSPEGGHGNPLQDSCLENSTDRGAWPAIVRDVSKSQIQLKRLSTHKHLTPCDPLNCILPGSSDHEISQERILELVAISFSRGSFQPRNWTCVSCIAGGFLTYWAIREAPLSPWLAVIVIFCKASVYSARDPGSIAGFGRSPGEGNGNPLQYIAWKIPWTEEPGRLQPMGSQRVGHDWATSLHFTSPCLHSFQYINVHHFLQN